MNPYSKNTSSYMGVDYHKTNGLLQRRIAKENKTFPTVCPEIFRNKSQIYREC